MSGGRNAKWRHQMVKSRSFLKLLSGIRVLCDNLQMNPLLTRLSVESEMERLHAVSREAGYEVLGHQHWSDRSRGILTNGGIRILAESVAESF